MPYNAKTIVSDSSGHKNLMVCLFKLQSPRLCQEYLNPEMSPGNLHFKLSSQVILMQVVQSPHFEKHRIDEGQQESTSA